MARIFPTGTFGFLQQEIDIERQSITGGQSLSGDTDRISADGGGRVFAQFGGGNLVDRQTVLAWRALLGLLEEGATPMVVAFCDARHQPYGNAHLVTYSDGALHSDGTPFSGGGPSASATEAAALRATTIQFTGEFAQPLIGGEWFSIEHPAKGWRAYKVVGVDPAAGTISFRPPLREAVVSGEVLDFGNPRCLMVQDGRAGSALDNRRHTVAAIRFVES